MIFFVPITVKGEAIYSTQVYDLMNTVVYRRQQQSKEYCDLNWLDLNKITVKNVKKVVNRTHNMHAQFARAVQCGKWMKVFGAKKCVVLQNTWTEMEKKSQRMCFLYYSIITIQVKVNSIKPETYK